MKILLADDHPLFREGVKLVLEQLDGPVEIIDAYDYPSLFAQAELCPDIDLALADLNMPGMPGLDGVAVFRLRFPALPLVVLTASESVADARQALANGAMGFIRKSSSSQDILNALNCVLDGGIHVPSDLFQEDPDTDKFDVGIVPIPCGEDGEDRHLTGRQYAVLKLLLQGKPNKTIAQELNVSIGTVKIHVAAIFRALGVTNRVEASIAARQFGLGESDR